jgi:hypothetical protein
MPIEADKARRSSIKRGKAGSPGSTTSCSLRPHLMLVGDARRSSAIWSRWRASNGCTDRGCGGWSWYRAMIGTCCRAGAAPASLHGAFSATYSYTAKVAGFDDRWPGLGHPDAGLVGGSSRDGARIGTDDFTATTPRGSMAVTASSASSTSRPSRASSSSPATTTRSSKPGSSARTTARQAGILSRLPAH